MVVHTCLLSKIKTLCLFSKRQSVLKTLCGTTLAAVPSRGAAPQCPLSRADAVTGIDRPCLLASSFSRRLQGDFPPPSLAALHHPAALWAGSGRILVLIHAILCNSYMIISCFPHLSNKIFRRRAPGSAPRRESAVPAGFPGVPARSAEFSRIHYLL